MSSRPALPRGWSHNTESPAPVDARFRTQPDLNRPLPPPPPNSLSAVHNNSSAQRKPLLEPAVSLASGHSRSLSHPFPSFFGPRKTDKKGQHVRAPDADDSSDGMGLAGVKNGKQKATVQQSSQVTTGKCSTCDSTVRWPSDLKTFRCMTCLTINDLEPANAQPVHTDKNNGADQPPSPISLNHTHYLIDRCMNDLFRHVLHNRPKFHEHSNTTEALFVSDDEPDNGYPRPRTATAMPSPSRPRLQHRSPSEATLSRQISRKPLPSPARMPISQVANSPSQTRAAHVESDPIHTSPDHDATQTEPRFRAVEKYIAASFSGCAALNMSFLTVKPPPEAYQYERPKEKESTRRQPLDPLTTPSRDLDTFLSDMDAKTLLLGDFVENGSWWTGSEHTREDFQTGPPRERSPDRGRGTISARTPRINWLELAQWYRMIMHAGDDWRRRWSDFKALLSDMELELSRSVSIDKLRSCIMDSQLHLQRSLLKATENLVKRPKRPLRSPEDCRFLLMLLANPLLSPASTHRMPRRPSERLAAGKPVQPLMSSPSRRTGAPRRYNSQSGQNRHSGILKRILGQLAYLPNEVHVHLISWFTRFSDAHLTSLVDIVGGFVTDRLARQINKPVQVPIDPTEGLIPSFTEGGIHHASQVHAALEGRSNSQSRQRQDGKPKFMMYTEDWQIRAAARVMALLFQANIGHNHRRRDNSITPEQRSRSAGLNAKHQASVHGHMIPISNFYNSLLDHADLVTDFEAWETTRTKFTFCQYPFFLSIWAKIHILEHDARRQMETKAREAFFDSILSRKAVSQFLVLRVRRDCLVDDSLKGVSEVIGRGGSDIKKGLRIDFVDEEGVDAGGLRKEWFLLLVREIFDPRHGLFVYDDESQHCYFNPFCFESSEQFFLVGVLLGLAIYNSTILDVAFPPFIFKKMLASAPSSSDKLSSVPKVIHTYTLDDLAELRPSLARGLRQLLEFDGDVGEVFCRDFVVEMDRYGGTVQVPLCPGGATRPVTNANRQEFVDLYVYYLLDQSVARQYEPFKRGFFTVCGGNALSLFRPEEIELLIRGSDEPLDVGSLRAVATYDGWPKSTAPEQQPQVVWFWEFFNKIKPDEQRKLLSFITGSDRIPAMGATNLGIRLQLLIDSSAEESGQESQRYPIARTCFNTLGLYRYRRRETLEDKLWTAVMYSEGFGLK